MPTPTAFKVTKLKDCLSSIEFLETMGVLFYGAEKDAIDIAKAAISRKLDKAVMDDFEADQKK